jgi:hypothetical protein
METMLHDAKRFEADPFGYSALAWHKWGMLLATNGFFLDISKPPTAHDLKNPVLWLTHANALSEAAVCLVRNDPPLASCPEDLRTICHSQYYAVALMLVGYSLEVCLKAMIIIKWGVESFLAKEQNHFHHDLDELSAFIPTLSDKDRAMLKGLSYFVKWAGRYPDPGSRRVDEATDIFEIAETFQVSAKDLFELSGRVMAHTRVVTA